MGAQKLDKGYKTFLGRLRQRARTEQINLSLFDQVMQDVQPLTAVLNQQAHQAEFILPIWDYLDIMVSDERIRKGRKALREYRKLFNRVESTYSVEAGLVAAVWGLESGYGANRGNVSVITTLTTMAYQGRRAAYFEDELIAALRILQTDQIAPERMLGSWAGAMGHGQFMPSIYLSFAVDFNHDGRRDIWNDDPCDGLASIANFLTKHGWRSGQPCGVEVRLPEVFDHALTGLGQNRTVQEWRKLGVSQSSDEPIAEYGPASILLPAGAGSVALMVFRNFHVLKRYNNSQAYAIAAGRLFDRIMGGKEFVAEWPRNIRVLGRDEICELQVLLTNAGFDTHGVDGIVGRNTIAATRGCQKSMNLTADGFPGAELLKKLRNGSG